MKTIATLLALGVLSLGTRGVYANDCSAPLSFEKRRLAGDEVVDYYTDRTEVFGFVGRGSARHSWAFGSPETKK